MGSVVGVLAAGAAGTALGNLVKKWADDMRPDGTSVSSDAQLEGEANNFGAVGTAMLTTSSSLINALGFDTSLSPQQRKTYQAQVEARNAAKSLNYQFGDLDLNKKENSSKLAHALISDPSRIQALMDDSNYNNKDRRVAGELIPGRNNIDLNSGLAQRLNKDSIRQFLIDSIISDGGSDTDVVKFIAMIAENTKKTADASKDTLDQDKLKEQQRQVEANRKGAFKDAALDAINMNRNGWS